MITKTLRKWFASPRWVTAAWVIGLIVVWELGATYIASVKRSPQNVLPHLWQIAESVLSTQKVNGRQTALQLVLGNAWITLMRAGIGFVQGACVGFVLALLMSRFRALEKMFFPYLMIIQMIPILGMAPIVLAVTKDIDRSRVLIAAILTFYPVATSTLSGFKAVEKEKHDLMYSVAASRSQVYAKLMIPFAVPYLFAGLKIAAPLAITASILVDTLQGGGGLGVMMSQSLKHAMSIYVFWQIVFLSAAVGILSYQLMSWLEKFFSAGRPARMRKAKVAAP